MHSNPTCTYSATSASSCSTAYACSSSAAILANAAKNKVILPRLISPAAASETSNNRPMLLCIPPLAYESTVRPTMSVPIWPANCQVKRGQRSLSGTKENAATAAYIKLETKNNVQLRGLNDSEEPNAPARNTKKLASASRYKLK